MFNKLMWVRMVMCPTFGHLMANHHSSHFFFNLIQNAVIIHWFIYSQ